MSEYITPEQAETLAREQHEWQDVLQFYPECSESLHKLCNAAIQHYIDSQEVGINGLTEAETSASMSVRGLSKPAPEQRGDTVSPEARARLISSGPNAGRVARGAQRPEGREPEVWFCPDCGTISDEQTRCCPDWIRSREVTKNFAETCKRTFDIAMAREPLELNDKEISEIWENHTVDVFGRVGINPVVFARRLLAAANSRRAG